MLQGKTIILGVTGSIAAYKSANLASMLVKQHAKVRVLMTKNAMNFIHPTTFESLTGNKCVVDTFDRNFSFDIKHISMAKEADLVLIAPASANIIGKLACGIADDMLTTTIMACTCPVLVAPAMNVHMYQNAIVQDNMRRLEKFGYRMIEPAVGRLACGDIGAGKMPEEKELLEQVLLEAACPKDLKGLNVLVTAGPTQEVMDPVRYLTNHSSGKMGYALARAAARRGANVTLVSGPVGLSCPASVKRFSVQSAQEMFDEVVKHAPGQDIIIKAAAVSDYRPKQVSEEKIKKQDGDFTLELVRNPDILKYLGEHRGKGQFLCGFSMETQDMLENSRKKLQTKKIDMIAANNLKQDGAGFAGDTNILTLIMPEIERSLECMSKDAAAMEILDEIQRQRKERE